MFWWIRYRDRSGARRRESTFTQDWQKLNNFCGNGFRPEIAMFWMWYGKAKS